MANHQPTVLHSQFEAAYNSGNLDALVDLYEPGATLAPQPNVVVSGLDAIREAYRASLAAKAAIQVETLGMMENGEGMALLHGHWTLTATGPDGAPIRMEGRNTEVARRQPDGRWLFVIDNPFAP